MIKEIFNYFRSMIKNCFTFFICEYYSFRYKNGDPDFHWVGRLENLKSNIINIGVSIGVGWGNVDAVLPVMIFLKKNYNANIITIFPCANAGINKKHDIHRWNEVLSYSDALLINEVPTFPMALYWGREFRDAKKDMWFSDALEKELGTIKFKAMLTADENEINGFSSWFRKRFPNTLVLGLPISAYYYSAVDLQYKDRDMEYDYFCIPNSSPNIKLANRYKRRFKVTGSPRTDTWYIEYRKKQGDRLKKDIGLKVIGVFFSQLWYLERFSITEREEFSKALSETENSEILYIFKFHPRNSIKERKIFINKYVPRGVNFIVSEYDNLTIASMVDFAVTVGGTTSACDIVSIGTPLIEFFEKGHDLSGSNASFWEYDGKEDMTDFWIENNMAFRAKNSTELSNQIERLMRESITNNACFFKETQNSSKHIAACLVKGMWIDNYE